MREMRRKDRAIPEDEAISVLAKGEYGVLSTVGENGKPYGVPLNYCFVDGCIYFHSAVEGRKVEDVKRNGWVSFCVVGDTEVLPGKFSTRYESVIVSGVAEEVFGSEKQNGLEGLLRKYSAKNIEEGMKYMEGSKDKVRVFKVVIEEMSGKARRKKHRSGR